MDELREDQVQQRFTRLGVVHVMAISGYHDASGSLEVNQELAKQRALAVRDAIKAAGIADERFELKKPELTQGTGGDAEARRVEVAVH